jgi:hypothetical protein
MEPSQKGIWAWLAIAATLVADEGRAAYSTRADQRPQGFEPGFGSFAQQ